MDVQQEDFANGQYHKIEKKNDSIEHNKEVALLTKILPTQA
jgi:hypothetical protein